MIEIKGIDPKMIANNIEPFEPTHPGELLRDEIEYRHISQKQLAADMGVSYTVLNDIVNCKRPVNTKFALLCEAASSRLRTGSRACVNLWLHFDSSSVRTAINIENQCFTKQTPDFTPKNVKSGVFSLSSSGPLIHNNGNQQTFRS